jgi:hypothetical protein
MFAEVPCGFFAGRREEKYSCYIRLKLRRSFAQPGETFAEEISGAGKRLSAFQFLRKVPQASCLSPAALPAFCPAEESECDAFSE